MRRKPWAVLVATFINKKICVFVDYLASSLRGPLSVILVGKVSRGGLGRAPSAPMAGEGFTQRLGAVWYHPQGSFEAAHKAFIGIRR